MYKLPKEIRNRFATFTETRFNFRPQIQGQTEKDVLNDLLETAFLRQ